MSEKNNAYDTFLITTIFTSLTFLSALGLIYSDRIHHTRSWNWNKQEEILTQQKKEKNEKITELNKLCCSFLQYTVKDNNAIYTLQENLTRWRNIHGSKLDSLETSINFD